jgi:hypothetical protein
VITGTGSSIGGASALRFCLNGVAVTNFTVACEMVVPADALEQYAERVESINPLGGRSRCASVPMPRWSWCRTGRPT